MCNINIEWRIKHLCFIYIADLFLFFSHADSFCILPASLPACDLLSVRSDGE